MNEDITVGTSCPECGQGQLVSLTRTEDFEFDLEGETVQVHAENVPFSKCDKCGETMTGPAAAKMEHEAICCAAALLLPSEIKAIREKLGWTQDQLADLTGFSVETISLWERGRRLQKRSDDNILRALGDCPPFREYLEELGSTKITKQRSVLVSQQKAC